jgi:hypothetical protein
LDYLSGVSLADMVASQTSGQKISITPRTCGSAGYASRTPAVAN